MFQYRMDEDERTLIAYIEHVNESFFDFVYTNNETSQTVFPSKTIYMNEPKYPNPNSSLNKKILNLLSRFRGWSAT